MKTFFKVIFIFLITVTGLVFVAGIYYVIKEGKLHILHKKFPKNLSDLNIDIEEVSKKINKEAMDLLKEADRKEKQIEKKIVKEFKKTKKNISKRQEEIMKFFDNKPEIAITDIIDKFNNVSARTLRRDLSKLEDLGYVKQFGKTKNSRYKLTR